MTKPHTVCMTCNKATYEGDQTQPHSHGYCLDCFERETWNAAIDAALAVFHAGADAPRWLVERDIRKLKRSEK